MQRLFERQALILPIGLSWSIDHVQTIQYILILQSGLSGYSSLADVVHFAFKMIYCAACQTTYHSITTEILRSVLQLLCP